MPAALLLAAALMDWSPSGLRSSNVGQLAAGSGPHPRLYAGITGGSAIYRSDDGGRTWQLRTTPFSGIRAIAVDGHDPDRVYASHVSGFSSGFVSKVHVSADGGTSWAERLEVDDATACSIAVDARIPGAVYVSCTEVAKFFRSDDGGESFAELPAPTRGGLLATAADGALISATGAVFVSRDRGLSWSLVAPPHQPCPIRALATDPVDPRVWYVGVGEDNSCGVVSRTDDGGGSWTVVADFGRPVNSIATAAGVTYVSVGPTVPSTERFDVFATMDGGVTWIDLSGPTAPGWGYLVATGNGSHVYASTKGGVYRLDTRQPRAVAAR